MFKHFSFLFLYLSLIPNLFSQKITITTEFSQNGNLYENPSDNSQTLIEFKENEECTIVDYLGNDVYEINYKKLVGFVKAEYLFVNDNMIELVIDYEDKIKIEAIEKEKKRKQEVDALIAKSEEEKQRQEALELKRKYDEELNKKLEDSIAKVRTEEKQNQEALELKKKREEELNKRREDSIIKVREQEKQIQELLEVRRKREIELNKIKEDSIVKIREDIKKKEALELKRKYDEALNKKLEDSIAKVRTEEKQNQEALELKKKREEELNKRREDSIIKVREQEKQIQELLEVRRKRETELSKIREDSIVKIREEIKKKEEGLLIKKREETLKKAKEDSVFIVSQEKEIENEVSEKSEFRSICHFSIDEFDQFYGIRTIRTSPYSLNKNLMVELYRQAQRTNVFFNLSEDLGCSSYIPGNRSSVKVTLENDTVVTFYHSWDIDCGDFSFKGNLSVSDMDRLKKSPIKSITLRGTEGFYEITNVDYKEFFIDKLKCIE